MSHFWWIIQMGCRNSSRVARHWMHCRRNFASRHTVDRKDSRRWRVGHGDCINCIFCSKNSSFLRNCLLECGCFCAISSHIVMWAMAGKYMDNLGVFRALFWAFYAADLFDWFDLLRNTWIRFSMILCTWVQFMQQSVERFMWKSNDA